MKYSGKFAWASRFEGVTAPTKREFRSAVARGPNVFLKTVFGRAQDIEPTSPKVWEPGNPIPLDLEFAQKILQRKDWQHDHQMLSAFLMWVYQFEVYDDQEYYEEVTRAIMDIIFSKKELRAMMPVILRASWPADYGDLIIQGETRGYLARNVVSGMLDGMLSALNHDNELPQDALVYLMKNATVEDDLVYAISKAGGYRDEVDYNALMYRLLTLEGRWAEDTDLKVRQALDYMYKPRYPATTPEYPPSVQVNQEEMRLRSELFNAWLQFGREEGQRTMRVVEVVEDVGPRVERYRDGPDSAPAASKAK